MDTALVWAIFLGLMFGAYQIADAIRELCRTLREVRVNFISPINLRMKDDE